MLRRTLFALGLSRAPRLRNRHWPSPWPPLELAHLFIEPLQGASQSLSSEVAVTVHVRSVSNTSCQLYVRDERCGISQETRSTISSERQIVKEGPPGRAALGVAQF